MEKYPAVRFMVAYGRGLAVPVGLALPAFVLLGLPLAGWHWLWLVGAVAAGGVLGFAFRVFAELTQVIAEMLLPQ